MALPVVIPNTFANANASIPLSQLDNNFSTVAVAINGMANGAEALSNVNITGGSIANASLSNVSISSGNVTINVANVTTLDATTVEVTNIKAKDGTASATIADSTGVMTIGSSVLTTTDINGGTIDGAAIGGSTPAAGAFTTLTTSSTVTLNGGTANGVTYLDGSKVLTSGSALTWNGSTLLIGGNTRFGSGAFIPGFATASDASLANNASLRGTNAAGSTAFELIKLNTSDQVVINNDGADAVLTSAGTSVRWTIFSEQMRLTSTGLGIGTSSPSNKFVVSASGAQGIEINPNVSGTSEILAYNRSGSAWNPLKIITSNFKINISGGSDALTLDSSGNLGLGVTPNTWYSGYTAFEFGGYGSLTSRAATNDTELSSNAYRNASATYIYKKNGTAQTFDMANGAFTWNIAGSGTAGNAISFTQAMTLDASGNLAVGTTTTNGRLSVYATTNAQIALTDGTLGANYGGAVRGYGVGGQGGFVELGVLDNATYTKGVLVGSQASTIQFYTGVNSAGNTERARIDSSGNLLVGTTSSTAKLTVKTTSGLAIGTTGYSGDLAQAALEVQKYDNNTTTSQVLMRFAINQGGAGQGQINANGALTAAFGSYSDARLKENVVTLPPQLNNIMALRPVEFDYIESEGGGHQIGFIAQEMQEVYPDVVGERAPDGMFTVTGWSKTEARLVKAIQEQQAIIESLTARIAALEAK